MSYLLHSGFTLKEIRESINSSIGNVLLPDYKISLVKEEMCINSSIGNVLQELHTRKNIQDGLVSIPQ